MKLGKLKAMSHNVLHEKMDMRIKNDKKFKANSGVSTSKVAV